MVLAAPRGLEVIPVLRGIPEAAHPGDRLLTALPPVPIVEVYLQRAAGLGLAPLLWQQLVNIPLKDGNDPQQLKEFPIAVDAPLHSVMHMETAGFVDQDLGKLLEQYQRPVNLGQPPEAGKDGAHQFVAASPLNGV